MKLNLLIFMMVVMSQACQTHKPQSDTQGLVHFGQHKIDHGKEMIYDCEALKKDFHVFGNVQCTDFRSQFRAVRNENGNNILVVSLDKGTGTGKSGAFEVSLEPKQSYTLSYKVRFPKSFEWSKGGKLPGLAGGQAPYTGCVDVSKGKGFSARLMWGKDGLVVPYVYHKKKQDKCGDKFKKKVSKVYFKANKWHKVFLTVTMNDKGGKNANGKLDLKVDKDTVLKLDNLEFCKKNKCSVDRFLFDHFRGGKGREWRSKKKYKVEFDDFFIGN